MAHSVGRPADDRRQKLDIVAIGASAGGVEAISNLVRRLPRDLPAAVVVVLHRPAGRASALPAILARECPLPVVIPEFGEALRHGVCYVGHPDRHLVMGPNAHWAYLVDSQYRGRNIDELFCSLARYADGRTIGVILSGSLDDGSAGLKAIKDAGGMALVQSPEQAAFPDMPRNAIRYNGPVDCVGSIPMLAAKIRECAKP